MPMIKHIILDYSTHFLVVDGTRGEPCTSNSEPATHPSGYFRFRDGAYGVPLKLRGKLFLFVEGVQAEEEEIGQCEPALKAYREFSEITNECHRVNIARYEPAPGAEEPQQQEEVSE